MFGVARMRVAKLSLHLLLECCRLTNRGTLRSSPSCSSAAAVFAKRSDRSHLRISSRGPELELFASFISSAEMPVAGYSVVIIPACDYFADPSKS
jgi:hypothetical protein